MLEELTQHWLDEEGVRDELFEFSEPHVADSFALRGGDVVAKDRVRFGVVYVPRAPLRGDEKACGTNGNRDEWIDRLINRWMES